MSCWHETKHKVLAVVCLCFAWNNFLSASTAIFVVTPEGIAAGTDGKAVSFSGFLSGDRGQSTIQKLVLLHDHILIAEIGLGSLEVSPEAVGAARARGQEIPEWVSEFKPYSFPAWVARLEKKTPPNISVKALAEVVKDDLSRTFMPAEPLIREWAIGHKDAFAANIANLVIAGMDNCAPVVYSVILEFDREHLRLKTPRVEVVYPQQDIALPWVYMPAGSYQTAIRDFLNPNSEEYKRIAAAIPKELNLLRSGQKISPKQTMRFVSVLLGEEVKASSEYVGLPIYVGFIPCHKKPTIVRYDVLPSMEPEKGHTKKN